MLSTNLSIINNHSRNESKISKVCCSTSPFFNILPHPGCDWLVHKVTLYEKLNIFPRCINPNCQATHRENFWRSRWPVQLCFSLSSILESLRCCSSSSSSFIGSCFTRGECSKYIQQAQQLCAYRQRYRQPLFFQEGYKIQVDRDAYGGVENVEMHGIHFDLTHCGNCCPNSAADKGVKNKKGLECELWVSSYPNSVSLFLF